METKHVLSTGIVMILRDSNQAAPFVRLKGDLSRWDATPEAEVEAAVKRWGYRVDWDNLGVYGPDAIPLDPL